ncbi:MAG: class II aldolase/adducin family protein [Proteobacteria bacterium]|nr:class II aldolase/adducin family protein [Pseudomonadota bacterium]
MEITARPFETRRPPTFESREAERAHALARLAAACRVFGARGYSEGLLGHLTVRDPEFADRLWVNPIGVPMRQVQVADLVQVNHDGAILAGKGPVNPAGLLLHAAVHRARPDVAAMCHAHARAASTWSALGRVLDPITQDACVFYERQALIREPRLVRDADSATRFAAAFGSQRVAIHVNHGIFTTGQTIDEAAWWFMQMNECCVAQLGAEAAGRPATYAPEEARWIASTLGTPLFGWLSFQSVLDDLRISQPDIAG